MSSSSGGISSELSTDNLAIVNNRSEMQRKASYAAVLERSLVRTSRKNVLEVVLEKDFKGTFAVSEAECAKFLLKLGLDMTPGASIESIQICPSGRGVVYVTLRDQIDLSRYCRYDIIDITTSGIRSMMVKPVGKREVVVNVKGLHPNTKDDVVLDYFGKFGQIVTSKVIYSVFTEGPLKGIKNGDRNYKIELMPNTNIGSYHVIDGQKVTVRYAGQQQTCARCLKSARECKGSGVARRCEAAGGQFGAFAVPDLLQ